MINKVSQVQKHMHIEVTYKLEYFIHYEHLLYKQYEAQESLWEQDSASRKWFHWMTLKCINLFKLPF